VQEGTEWFCTKNCVSCPHPVLILPYLVLILVILFSSWLSCFPVVLAIL